MSHGRAARCLLTVAAAATLVLAPAADAAQKKGKKPGSIRARTATSVGSGDAAIVTATAKCPKKTRAVGGGFSTLPTTPEYQAIPYESVKVGQKRWRSSVQIFDSGPAETLPLTTYVYCRKGAPKTSEVVVTVPTPAQNQAAGILKQDAIATCPGKKEALAGGFSTPAPWTPAAGVRNVVIESFPVSPVSWQVTTALAFPHSMSSHAYCANVKNPPKPVTSTSTPAGGELTIGAAAAPCSGKRNVLAGGFAQAGQPGVGGGFFVPYESARLDRKSWRAAGSHVGTAVTTLDAIALCG